MKLKLKNEEHGQITIEFILLIGFSLILIISVANTLNYENELNIAMSAARNGAIEGSGINGIAIYPKNSFDDYIIKNPILTYPDSIKIIKIEKINKGQHEGYDKTHIQLKVHASSSSLKTTSEKNSAGDRINFYMRKSIAVAFKTTNLSNSLYNPSFSNNYVFTTLNVNWV